MEGERSAKSKKWVEAVGQAGRKEGKREEGGRLFEIHKSFPDLLEGATWKRRMRG